jgi:adenylate cyclase
MTKSYLEIERKFLVRGAWPQAERIQDIRQIYINPGQPVSTRLREASGNYFLTLKAGLSATTRQEFEISVEADMGRAMMAAFGEATLVEKKRHDVLLGSALWEVDVFAGANAGLIIAEIELSHAQADVVCPAWIGREITHDARFTNHALSLHPFGRWGIAYSELL